MSKFLDSTGVAHIMSLVKSAIGAKAAATHTHGNITNAGALQTSDVAIANGDKLVVTDSSDSNKVARTSTAFDGSTTSKALTQKGTFENIVSTSTSGLKLEIVTSMPSSPDANTVYIVK